MVEFDFLGHACVSASQDGFRILHDPWFGQTINNTFYSYPSFGIPSAEFVASIDALQISHIHRDHCNEATLSIFRRDIPIYIAQHRQRTFFDRIKSYGFSNIIEVLPGPRGVSCGPFRLNFVVSPFDGSFDSVVVLRNENQNFVLGSDCILSTWGYSIIKSTIGKIDGAFLGYSPLDTYPICYDFSDCADLKYGILKDDPSSIKRDEYLRSLSTACRILEPGWVVPYASGIRFLAQDQLQFNKQFNSPYDVERIGLQTEVKIPQPGDKLETVGSSAKAVTVSPRLQSYAIPEGLIQPSRSPNDFSISNAPLTQSQASSYFLKHLQLASVNWVAPMRIGIEIFACDGVSRLSYEFDGRDITTRDSESAFSRSDIIIQYSMRDIEKVLSGLETLTRIQWWFGFRARILRLVPGQMAVHLWGLQPSQYNS